MICPCPRSFNIHDRYCLCNMLITRAQILQWHRNHLDPATSENGCQLLQPKLFCSPSLYRNKCHSSIRLSFHIRSKTAFNAKFAVACSNVNKRHTHYTYTCPIKDTLLGRVKGARVLSPLSSWGGGYCNAKFGYCAPANIEALSTLVAN